MATFNEFNSWTTKVGGAVNLTTDTFKVMLVDVEPIVTNEVYSDISTNEVASGNGYTTTGEISALISWGDSVTPGLAELVLTDVSWTCDTAAWASFQYAVVYDSTTGDLIGWHTFDISIILGIGEIASWDTTIDDVGIFSIGNIAGA